MARTDYWIQDTNINVDPFQAGHYIVDDDPEIRFEEIDILSYSDLSGSTTTQANINTWTSDFADSRGHSWFVIHGAHGWLGIAVCHERLTADEQAALDTLDRYPVLDDEEFSRVEADRVSERWEEYGADDFADAMRYELRNDAELSRALYDFAFAELVTNADHHIEESDGSMFFNHDKAVAALLNQMRAGLKGRGYLRTKED